MKPATSTAGVVPVTLAQTLDEALRQQRLCSEEQEALSPLLDAALYAPLHEFVSRPGKGVRGRLTTLAHGLAGGQGQPPPELALVVEALHAGSLIIDDIEDASALRRGAPTLHRLHGMPVALNAGNFLYFWPQYLLRRAGLSPSAHLQAFEAMGACLLRCHEGQALDLTVRLSRLDRAQVAAVARGVSARKTGALIGLATALGGIAADAAPDVVAALQRFGEEVGIGLQMLDDLSGIIQPARSDKGLEDLASDRATWAWALMARELDARDYRHMVEQRSVLCTSGQLSQLLDRMRFPLSVRGPERVRAHFADAVDALFETLGASTLRPAVEHELSRLQARFFGEAGAA